MAAVRQTGWQISALHSAAHKHDSSKALATGAECKVVTYSEGTTNSGDSGNNNGNGNDSLLRSPASFEPQCPFQSFSHWLSFMLISPPTLYPSPFSVPLFSPPSLAASQTAVFACCRHAACQFFTFTEEGMRHKFTINT